MCSRPKKPDLEALIVQHMNFGKRRVCLARTVFFALALAGEAGELCNIIKKKLRGDRKYKGKAGAALFAKQVDGETVDLGNYVYMMAAHREIPLTKRMLEKLLEVEARDDDWNKDPLVKLTPRGPRTEQRKPPTNCRCVYKPTVADWTAAFKATKPRQLTKQQPATIHQDAFDLADAQSFKAFQKGGKRGRNKNHR